MRTANVAALALVLLGACGGLDGADDGETGGDDGGGAAAPTQEQLCDDLIASLTGCYDAYCSRSADAVCTCWASGRDVTLWDDGSCSCEGDLLADVRRSVCRGDLSLGERYDCAAVSDVLRGIDADCG